MLYKSSYIVWSLALICTHSTGMGPHNVVQMFAVTPSEIAQKTAAAIDDARHQVTTLITRPCHERTFRNTIYAIDTLIANSPLAITKNVLHVLDLVHPEESVRMAAREAVITINAFIIDEIVFNNNLYQAIKDYAALQAPHEGLTADEQNFIDNMLLGFKKIGLDLPEHERTIIGALTKEIEELSILFQKNISEDTTFLCLKEQELAGTPEKFINSLETTKDGYYQVNLDVPTYLTIMQECIVPTTRQQMWYAYARRAYPANEAVLASLITKRRALAHVLGYTDFATLNISDMMAKNPETVHNFLHTLLYKAQQKEVQEIEVLVQNLPESVTLVDGKIMPWDIPFLRESYKNTHFSFNKEVIKEYFPMNATVQGLFTIYQTFFDIVFIEHTIQGAWHPEVRLIEVRESKKSTTLGYILLDLHPRPYKFSHAGATCIIPAQLPLEGSELNPAVALVIANFPRAKDNQPALWDLQEAVRTFFHEFGHALHIILGRTAFAMNAGTEVKRDFVEMPSQMLELWLNDRDILHRISSHYLTHEQLPENIIDKIEKSHLFGKASWMTGQITYALVSLGIYQAEESDPSAIITPIINNALQNSSPYLTFLPDNKFYCSFIHLTGYSAGYYGYLWSQVYAVDLFDTIQHYGLMNTEIGRRYRDEILRHGGSKDPEELLYNFLGRKPEMGPFLHYFGIEE